MNPGLERSEEHLDADAKPTGRVVVWDRVHGKAEQLQAWRVEQGRSGRRLGAYHGFGAEPLLIIFARAAVLVILDISSDLF